MSDGQRSSLRLGYGFDPQPEATISGVCRGLCRGTERDRTESPARFGRSPDGQKLVYCPCCNTQLRVAKPGESGFQPGTKVSLATMQPGMAARARLMLDVVCRYDVLVFKEIKAEGDKGVTP